MSLKNHQSAASQASFKHESVGSFCRPGDKVSNDTDRLSSKADYGSSSEDSVSCDEASDSSSPYAGSPAPFDSQAEGIASWTKGSANSDEDYQRGIECLIPNNFQEAQSIFHGHQQALGEIMNYDSALGNPTNISIVSRRHHVDAVGDPPNANATWKRLEHDHIEKEASMPQNLFDNLFAKRNIIDPEKQDVIGVARTGQHKYRYGGGYIVLVVALVLGVVWCGLDMIGWLSCSSDASS